MKPEKFFQMKPQEEVLHVVNQDLVPHLPKLVLSVLLFLLPFFFLFPLLRLGTPGFLIFGALAISSLIYLIRNLTKRKNTALIITDRRIVDVDQKGLFDRVVTEIGHHQVDEASYRIRGMMPTIFRYGELRLKTSGETADIHFIRVRKPEQVQNLINELRHVIDDEEHSAQEEKIRRIAKRVSLDDLEEMEMEVRRRERDEALEEFTSDME